VLSRISSSGDHDDEMMIKASVCEYFAGVVCRRGRRQLQRHCARGSEGGKLISVSYTM
jgi:hypothetical protein